jgi:ribosomal protein S20
MKKLFWLAAGVTVGLIAAKEIEKNPKAKAAYDDATSRLRTLAQAFLEGYEEEEKPEAKAKPAATPKTAK